MTTETTLTDQQANVRDAMKHLADDSKKLVHIAGSNTKSALKKPTTGAAIAGAAVMGAVFTFGVVPTALAGAAAYVGYRLLRKRNEEAPVIAESR